MIFWLFGSAFLAGFFSSSHCVVMCSPLSAALGSQLTAQARLQRLALLNLGRITSYSMAGAAVGAIGAQFVQMQQLIGALLQLIAALFMLAMAAWIGLQWQGLQRFERLGQPLWRLVSTWSVKLLPINTHHRAAAYGLVWGFLPCGLIYSNLSVALSTGSALMGAVWMFGFGIGTSIAITASLVFSKQIIDLLQESWLKIVASIALTLYATTLIYLALRRFVF